ncbi:unnamed protein product, partial [Owenia fusiformis]
EMEDGGFTVVKYKKTRQHIRTCRQHRISVSEDNDALENTDVNRTAIINRLNEAILLLESSAYCSNLKKMISAMLQGDGTLCDVMEMVLYGVGNFSSCPIARYQLALYTILHRDCNVPPNKCFIYDPKFSDVEFDVLKELGYCIIEENEEGKRETSCPTLFYMPHCGKVLYNNLLWKNWNSRQLTDIMILGNSFSNMNDSLPKKEFTDHYSYIQRILPYTAELKVENNFDHVDIFNDTSLHYFKENVLNSIPREFWLKNSEPIVSDDVEIILKK